MATRRNGKPYIWATWLAKLLGGHQCVWSAWFKAHYRYEKHEEQAADLAEWNREHTAMMVRRRRELEREGFTVQFEDENSFKIEGETAVVAGKPDIVALKPGLALVVDGKTGRERDSDIWQVLIYLFALPKAFKDLAGRVLEGEVQYKRDDQRVTVTPEELTPERLSQVVALIKTIGSDTPPAKAPSAHECLRCNIGPADCPQRVRQPEMAAATEF